MDIAASLPFGQTVVQSASHTASEGLLSVAGPDTLLITTRVAPAREGNRPARDTEEVARR